MKTSTILKLALVFVLSFSVTGFAQDKEATKLLKSYIKTTNALTKTQSSETVLSLFGTNYQNNTAFIGLTGVLNRTTTTYSQLQEKLEKIQDQ